MNIRDEIVQKRRERLMRLGHEEGAKVPSRRTLPLSPFGTSPFLVCEVKRSSPSRGIIAPGLDAPAQAARYLEQGVTHISVLTEPEYFSGSLDDLIAIKTAFPQTAVLRKDFLLDMDDINVSFRAGADAILLIASLLTPAELQNMYNHASSLGMEVLLEVHSPEDCLKAALVQPRLTGINCRDLKTFRIDPIIPLRLKRDVSWPTKLVFESGILSAEQGLFALRSGFAGLLVGEGAVKKPQLVAQLKTLFGGSHEQPFFWERLYRPVKPRPLVKICGITNRQDAQLAVNLGADILGFILAPSPRQAPPQLLAQLADLKVLKAAVVVTTDNKLEPRVKEMLAGGLIDVVQFHGDEGPGLCSALAFPYFKALQIASSLDLEKISAYQCPRVLLDSYSPQVRGGTGQTLAADLLRKASQIGPLWLAGGISADNIKEIISTYKPELIDAASRLEASPGKKDPDKLKGFFAALPPD